jgi:hypothetical protein
MKFPMQLTFDASKAKRLTRQNISIFKPMRGEKDAVLFQSAFSELIHKKMPLFSHKTIMNVKNNITFNLHLASAAKKETSVIQNGVKLFDKHHSVGNGFSEYECYLQRTMMKDILGKVESLGNVISKKFSYFINKQASFENVNVNLSYNYPQLQFKKETVQMTDSNAAEQNTFIENKIETHKHFKAQSSEKNTVNTESIKYGLADVNMILEKVYTGIEEQLYKQRLKKGYW